MITVIIIITIANIEVSIITDIHLVSILTVYDKVDKKQWPFTLNPIKSLQVMKNNSLNPDICVTCKLIWTTGSLFKQLCIIICKVKSPLSQQVCNTFYLDPQVQFCNHLAGISSSHISHGVCVLFCPLFCWQVSLHE